MSQADAMTSWTTNYLHPTQWDQQFAPMALHDMFFASAERMGRAALADFMGRKYSYAEMADSVRRVAKGLQDKGVGKGDRVGLFLPNVPHYLAAYYGALAAGATVVNFSPLYTVDELAHQVADSGTTILFTVSAAALLPTAIKVLDCSDLKGLVVGSVAEALPRVKSWPTACSRPKKWRPFPATPELHFMPICSPTMAIMSSVRATRGTTSLSCNIPAVLRAHPKARCSAIRT